MRHELPADLTTPRRHYATWIVVGSLILLGADIALLTIALFVI